MTPDQEESRRQFLDRLGIARKSLSQAAGWIRGIAPTDLMPFGIDIKPEVAESLEDVVIQLDELIEMIRGDKVADALALYRYKSPQWRRYLDLAQTLWGVMNP